MSLPIIDLRANMADAALPRRHSIAYCEMVKTGSGSLRAILPFVVASCRLQQNWSTGPGEDRDVGCYATKGPDGRLIGSLISHLGDLPLQIAVFKLCYVAFTTW